MERSFVMIKPDGVRRRLIGCILKRFEKKNLTIKGLKLIKIEEEKAKIHYKEHTGKDFFDKLIKYITSGPVVAMVWEGENCISEIRKMVGATDPQKALPGTIRGDYGLSLNENIIHASDSEKNAKREIELFFDADELV
ncbi:MAG: nucleoside-diphosphate kinase [Thermosediminibacterales bacterium]|nr:nucleoside-diphosphate kinase [Thermosediminibacterales bacterium]